MRRGDQQRATEASTGARLAAVWKRMDASGQSVVVPDYTVERLQLTLEPGDGQSAPLVVAKAEGTVELATYTGSPPQVAERSDPAPFEQTLSWSSRTAAT